MHSRWNVASLNNFDDTLRVDPKASVADMNSLARHFYDNKGKYKTESFIAEFCENISDNLIASLPTSLKTLTVNGCHRVSELGLNSFKGKKLEYLSLYWMPRLVDIASVIRQNKTTLVEVNLAGCQLMNDRVCEALTKCKNLKKLDITRCHEMTDYGLSVMLETIGKNLAVFNCYANPHFTVQSMRQFRHARSLIWLDLCGSMVDDFVLQAIVDKNKDTLTTINLTWCIRLTDHAPRTLSEAPKLVSLSLFGNKQLGRKAVEHLITESGKQLEELDIHG